MVIYLDLLMLYDLLINTIMLIIINISFNDKVNILRILVVSIISSLMLVGCVYSFKVLNILKVFGGVIVCLLCFTNLKKINSLFSLEKLLKTGSYYAFNFSFVGLLHIFKIDKWYLLILVFSIILVLMLFISLKKYVLFIKTNEYSVIVKINTNYYHLKGFLDTGNKSSYNGIPIIYISDKYKTNMNNDKKFFIVPIKTISGESYLEGMKPDLFVIESNKLKKAKSVIVCFTNIKEDCILNPLLFVWEVWYVRGF